MSSPADAWLASWRATVPPSLAAVVEEAVSDAGEGATDAATALAEAALTCLRRAVRIGDDRAAALHLLAADALITAACEAASGTDGQLDELAQRFCADRLGSLFREELATDPS